MTGLTDELRRAAATLAEAGVASPIVDARLLAAHVLGCAPTELLFCEKQLPAEYWEAIERRAQREPLQHIIGHAASGLLDFEVGPGVFIPRPETELLAEWGVEAVRGVDTPQVVDLCTGTGVLAVTIAHARPDATVTAVELSADAYAWARKNIATHAPQIELLHGDVTDIRTVEHLSGRMDLVLSNPPYVPLGSVVDIETTHDPHMAVFGGDSGLEVIEPMVEVVFALLRPGGMVGIEHDDTTGKRVCELFARHGGFERIKQHQDLAGRDRFVTASKVYNQE